MADITLHTNPPDKPEFFAANARVHDAMGEDFTSLRVTRGRDMISFYFNHDERGAEQLHDLLVAVMDAFRQVDGAVQRQKQEVEVAA